MISTEIIRLIQHVRVLCFFFFFRIAISHTFFLIPKLEKQLNMFRFHGANHYDIRAQIDTAMYRHRNNQTEKSLETVLNGGRQRLHSNSYRNNRLEPATSGTSTRTYSPAYYS